MDTVNSVSGDVDLPTTSANENQPSGNSAPNSNSSRSGSSRRHRSRSHHHHGHGSGHHRYRNARRRRYIPKRAERNLVAAILGMVVIAVLISSLAEQKWFQLQGGVCKHKFIGAYQFLTPGIENSLDYKTCINSRVVIIMRSVIAFIFLAITSSLVAFFLDTLGLMKPALRFIRRHAVGNIVTAILCLTMTGFCYWAASDMEMILSENKLGEGSRVLVSFDIGYYLVTSSGALSIIIAATNLLRPYSSYEEPPRERLIDDWDQLLEAELASLPTGPGAATTTSGGSLPEPPAYTP